MIPRRSRSSSGGAIRCRSIAWIGAFLWLVAIVLVPASARAQVSLNCNLLANEDSLPGRGSSCWGYVDPNTGSEYAIHGNEFGTAIFNIDTPTDPRLTGFIPGLQSNWREMKVYQNYCYVGSEAPGSGLQIINLANPEAPVLAATSFVNGLSTIHSVTCDTTNARLYLNGSNGGMRILSLANPVAPVQLGWMITPYVHDSYVRGDTVYAACIIIGKMIVLDASNPADLDTVTQFFTELTKPHNSWPSEDGDYLFVTDETPGGRVTSWDITQITDPIQIDGYTADPSGDAHNVHVRGNLAYVAHYTSGLQILDVSAPDNLTRVGYYDTYPSPGGLFNGAWGVFNYFPSGTIVVSDIESGMFLIEYVPNASTVRGQVSDEQSGLPLANAEVRVLASGASDSTDVAGDYAIVHEAGTYNLRARAFGYDSLTVMRTLVAGDTLLLDFDLTKLPTDTLSGSFRYPAGSGIPNAIVRLRGTPLADTTDGSGAYSFPQVPEGTFTVALDAWTCVPESATTAVLADPPNTTVSFLFDGVTVAHNFEDTSAAGWAVNAQGGDNATLGFWTRVAPIGSGGGNIQTESDHTRDPLAKCWVTGQGVVGGDVNEQDVDDGRTSLYSPTMNLAGVANPTIEYFRWWYSSSTTDRWQAQISSNGGLNWVTTDSIATSQPFWKQVRLRVADYVTPSSQVRMRFLATDAGSASTVEAALDDFRVWGNDPVGIVEPTEGSSSGGPSFALLPNHPNPFAGATTIRFSLPAESQARVAVFSTDGRRVATLVDGALVSGSHALTWDGRDDRGRSVASGVYFIRLDAGPRTAIQKAILTR
jgi:choice-of-anchor B domain-containing protein